jgi:predicted amidohydrolase
MKVKVAAIRVVWEDGEDPESVLARGFEMAKEAARQEAKYIVLPEYFLNAQDPKDAMIPGPLIERTVELARELDVFFCAGMYERSVPVQEQRKNDFDAWMTAALIGPEGLLSVHRKIDIVYHWTTAHYRTGDSKTDSDCWPGPDFEMHKAGDIARIGVMICRDSFSNWAWSRVLSQDPQIIFHPNFRDSITRYGPDLPAMAKKYELPIVAADGHPKSESMIVDVDGTIVDFEQATERSLVGEVALADEHPHYINFKKIDNQADS